MVCVCEGGEGGYCGKCATGHLLIGKANSQRNNQGRKSEEKAGGKRTWKDVHFSARNEFRHQMKESRNDFSRLLSGCRTNQKKVSNNRKCGSEKMKWRVDKNEIVCRKKIAIAVKGPRSHE